VIDHFDIALTQDPARASAQQIMDGVRVIREELIRALARHGVSMICPAPNDEFQPGRHEAIMQQPAEGVEPGCIAACYQPGYALREGDVERIIRAAKVAVAPM
jgi:molecular chaperone GrpE